MNNVVILMIVVASLGLGMFLSQKFPQQFRSCCGLSAVRNAAAQTAVRNATSQSVQVGNKICPVTGNPIGVMGPGVQEEYKGKVYTLCCGGCIGIFESDPERYSKIADDEVKGQTQ